MARINLSLDNNLFKLLEKDSSSKNITVNVMIVSYLEELYKQNPFDYAEALGMLKKDIENLKDLNISIKDGSSKIEIKTNK